MLETILLLLGASPLASGGFAPRDIHTSSITYPAEKMRVDRKFSRINRKFDKFAKFVKK